MQIGAPVSQLYPYEIEDFGGMAEDHLNRVSFVNGNKLMRFHGYYDLLQEHKSQIHSLYQTDKNQFIGTESSFEELVIDSINNYNFKMRFRKVEDLVSHIAQCSYGDFILSKNTVYHFEENVARKYTFPGIVDYLTDVNGSTIVHDDENGLSIFVGGKFKIVNKSLFLSKENVVEIKSINVGQYVVATKDNGLYIFDGESFIPFATDITDGKGIKALEIVKKPQEDYEVVILTTDNELIAIDRSGFQLYVKEYSTQVYGLLYSETNLLYVATAKGMEVFFYSLPFQVVDFTTDPIHGPLSIFNNRFYWGSVDGLFYKNITETSRLTKRKVKVKDTSGKVGKLDIVNSTLLMSHEDGLYDILPKFGARFIPNDKFYNFTEFSNDYLIGYGKRKNYLLKKIRNKWVLQGTLDNLPIHPKSVVYHKQSILWLVDRDYNLISYAFNSKTKQFTELSRERNDDKVEVFSMNDQLILLKDHKAYEWSDDEFVLSKELSAVLGNNLDLEQIINDQYGNVWYIEKGNVGIFRSVVERGERKYKKLKIAFPFSDPRSIYPYDKNNVFINNGDHYVKIDLEKYEQLEGGEVVIDRIYSVSDQGITRNIYLKDNEETMPGEISCKSTSELHMSFYSELRPDSRYLLTASNSSKTLEQPKYIGSPEIFEDSRFTFRLRDFYGQESKTELTVKSPEPFVGSLIFWIMMGLVNLIIWIIAFILGYKFKKVRS